MRLWLRSNLRRNDHKPPFLASLLFVLLVSANIPCCVLLDQHSLSRSIVDALIERSLGEEPETSELQRMSIWQLFNQCSHAYLQAADRTLNARGGRRSHCFTDFYVRVSKKGTILLEHALTKRFICFNRRKRITIRREANDQKCHFREHMTTHGFTELESAWQRELFLGFNRKGRFQDPRAYHQKRKCFRYLKIERSISDNKSTGCHNPSNPFSIPSSSHLPSQETLLAAARQNVFDKIKATFD